MPTFRYKAYNSGGAAVSGTIEADTERQAMAQLKAKGLLPREVQEEGAPGTAAKSFSFQRGVSAADLSLFTRRLATLVASAVPLFEAVAGAQAVPEEEDHLARIGRGSGGPPAPQA